MNFRLFQRAIRFSRSGRVLSETSLSALWPRLPARVTSIDAIYQRPHDRVVVIFKGKEIAIKRKYWVRSATAL
jgi:hypothetical protein